MTRATTTRTPAPTPMPTMASFESTWNEWWMNAFLDHLTTNDKLSNSIYNSSLKILGIEKFCNI